MSKNTLGFQTLAWRIGVLQWQLAHGERSADAIRTDLSMASITFVVLAKQARGGS